MKGSARSLLLTVALAALAAAVGAWGGAQYVVQRSREPTLHAFVHQELKLTAEQDRRLEAIERDFAARRRGREAELRAANAALAAALQSRREYSPEVQAAVERFHDAMGELQKETILHVFSMRKVLTPEQAAAFDKRVADSLTDEGP